MASLRSKEKVSAALRKLFTPEKNKTNGGVNGDGPSKSGSGNAGSGANGVASPAKPGASMGGAAGPSKAASPAKRLRGNGVAPAASGPVPINCTPPPLPLPTAACSSTSAASTAAAAAAAAVNRVPPSTAAAAAAGQSLMPSVNLADTSIRSRRLMKELRDIQRLMRQPNPVFTVELQNDNLFEWNARLHVVDPESPLARDMLELGVPHITLHLSFPENFPFAPPFMMVVEPRIEKGYVMEGGAICMELLTPRGWASAYTVEALLMQFSASVVKGRGRIARYTKNVKEFNRQTAEMAFRSLVKTHDKYGWVTPALSDG